MKLHKLTKKKKKKFSMPWKSSKSMQPSEKHLCLKTAELQVQTVGVYSILAQSCSHTTVPAGETQRFCKTGQVMRTSSCNATGEGKSRSLEQWMMAMPSSTVHGN